MPRLSATRSPVFFAPVLIAFVLTALCGASAASAATTIIVNWSIDADSGSNTDTCSYTQGGLFFPDADGRCTFRRALREAGARPDVDRPITIVFSGLATGGSAADQLDDANYDAGLGVWTLPLSASNNLPDLKRQSILDDACNVTISGPNTRSNRGNPAPSVFIQLKSPLTLGCEGNIVQYLGFFGGSSVRLMEPDNTFRYNSWGLTTNGTAISFQDLAP